MPLTPREYDDLHALLEAHDAQITEICEHHHPTSPLTETIDAIYDKVKSLTRSEPPHDVDELVGLIAAALEARGAPVHAAGYGGYSNGSFWNMEVSLKGHKNTIYAEFRESEEVLPE